MAATFSLADSKRVRFFTGAIMYFAQGIPQGLIGIAVPAWLASLGVSAGAISSYLAVIVLPWAFKLVTGPLMDRFGFLPMGRRRPWVIGAQLGLSLSLLALMLIDNPAEQIGLLMLIGVLISSFAATQDVAVDGMSIDLTPVREQGRLNAYMSFGKAIGWSSSAAVTGLTLVTWGLAATAVLTSIVSGAVLLAILLVRENAGERMLPWSRGEAATTQAAGSSFGDVFSGLNKVLWTRASAIVLIIMFFDGLAFGYGQALMPIAAINLFGYTTPQWSQLVAMMGLTGAVLSLAIGPMIDRFGAKRTLIMTIALVALHAFMLAQTQQLWENTLYVRVMLSLWVMMIPIVMVSTLALAMAVCSSHISATQFAIYMSVANLGHSIGSKVFGMVSETSSYVDSYLLLSLFVVVMIVVVFFHRHRPEEAAGERGNAAPQFALAMAGGGGGMYISGNMRCPKCRADMEAIDHDGVEVDRCNRCNGIWFDAGEIEALKDSHSAAVIDTGDAKLGRQHNAVDNYRCPRCSGEMLKTWDAEQKHIWYETCGDCSGSFLDAGEFRDLSEKSVSDFFKGLVVGPRV